jgi:hypothetical protein
MIDLVKSLEIFHFQDPRSNKLWGFFQSTDDVWWVFWCGVGANPSFKSHGASVFAPISVVKLRREKTSKGYKPTTPAEISAVWPSFDAQILERWLWHSLAYVGSDP